MNYYYQRLIICVKIFSCYIHYETYYDYGRIHRILSNLLIICIHSVWGIVYQVEKKYAVQKVLTILQFASNKFYEKMNGWINELSLLSLILVRNAIPCN